MTTKKMASAFLGLACVLSLSACEPVTLAAGAGATLGVAAAQEGGIKGAAVDAAIRLKIADLWLKHDIDMYRRIDMTVKEGRVLITGSVPDPDMRVDAVRLAWQADGVRQVINEIKVNSSPGVTGFVKDTWITGSISSRLLLDKYVQSINYNVDTVGGTVYLMGVAQDQRELDRVIGYARNTKYVKNVVSYVRLRGETPPGVQTPTGVPASEDAAPAPVQSSYDYAPQPAPSYGSGAVEGEMLPPPTGMR